MDRHWLITWTCYGTWVSGDARGFVSNIRNEHGDPIRHNIPGTLYDADLPLLEAWMRDRMNGDPVELDQVDAEAMIAQYQETARIRGWVVQAASVMFNHTHIVVSVPGDPDPQLVMETLKSWATRALKKRRPLPSNGTFWTAKGSKRKLKDDEALLAAVIYAVKKQPNPLATWFAASWREALDAYESASRAP